MHRKGLFYEKCCFATREELEKLVRKVMFEDLELYDSILGDAKNLNPLYLLHPSAKLLYETLLGPGFKTPMEEQSKLLETHAA